MVAEGNRSGMAITGQNFCTNRDLDVADAARKQTLSDARAKIKWQGFEFLLHEARRDDLEEPWIGHRVRIADGTKLNVPNTVDLQGHFATPNNKSGHGFFPQAWMVTLLNSTSAQPIAAKLGSFKTSERELMLQLLPDCSPGDVLLVDRGLGGAKVYLECYSQGVDIIHRVTTSGNKIAAYVADFLESKTASCLYAVQVEDNGEEVQLWMRLVLGPKDSQGKPIVFATTLLDEDKYSTGAIRDLYKRRWAIETAYGRIKGLLGLEKIRAKSYNGVMQEAFANLFVLSLGAIVDIEASQRLKLDRSKTVLNFKSIIEVIRRNMALIASTKPLTQKEIEAATEKIIHEASQIFWKKQPGRSCPRVSKQSIKSHNLCKHRKLAAFKKAEMQKLVS